MSHITIRHFSHEDRRAIPKANTGIEQVEVLLCNLLALRCAEEDRFVIPHDDIVVTLETAIRILRLSY